MADYSNSDDELQESSKIKIKNIDESKEIYNSQRKSRSELESLEQ
jgi:hypothetical protein